MLGAFANAFRTPDLRRKLLFVLLIIAIFRLGSQVPAPGVNVANVQSCLDDVGNSGIYSLINLFSGGALLQLTIFALGIMPYITASIILQLLVVVIPRLEALKKEGQSGQTKITQYTRYLTLGLADASRPPASSRWPGRATCSRAATSRCCTSDGTVDVPGHGRHHDRRHRRHHVARRADHRPWRRQRHVDPDLHPDRGDLPDRPVAGEERARAGGSSASSWSIGLAIVAAVIFIEQAQRRIPVQYARRMVGRKMFGGSSTYIPLKVNQAGVIPVIFASSLLYLPAMAVQFNRTATAAWVRWISELLRARRPPALHDRLLPPDRLLHLLLRLDHLQPPRGRGQHEEVRRLHPRDPGGQADRGLPVLRLVPHHASPVRCTSGSWRSSR